MLKIKMEILYVKRYFAEHVSRFWGKLFQKIWKCGSAPIAGVIVIVQNAEENWKKKDK
jgi:hypothetical protein